MNKLYSLYSLLQPPQSKRPPSSYLVSFWPFSASILIVMLLSSIIKVVQAVQYYLDPSPLDIVSNHTFQSHGSRSTHSATEITHAHALICTSSDISSLHTISCVMNMSTCASIVVVGVDAFIGNQCQPSPSHTNSPLTRICLFAPIFI